VVLGFELVHLAAAGQDDVVEVEAAFFLGFFA
jgi:hypothetical protein